MRRLTAGVQALGALAGNFVDEPAGQFSAVVARVLSNGLGP